MLSYLLLFTIIYSVFSFEQSCTSCKNYIPHNKGNPDLGLCKMFKNLAYPGEDTVILYNFAAHCRNDENLCGKTGFLYEPVSVTSNNKIDNDKINNDIKTDYDILTNRCCGEVNEKDELEELERDFFELFQKMKKYNTKRVYKTSLDLYKLFKK